MLDNSSSFTKISLYSLVVFCLYITFFIVLPGAGKSLGEDGMSDGTATTGGLVILWSSGYLIMLTAIYFLGLYVDFWGKNPFANKEDQKKI